MNLPTVELIPAFLFTCDSCGRDTFVRGITLAPESIDLDDLPASVDADAVREWLEAGGVGAFMTAPARVTCEYCGAEYGTTEP